MELLVLSVNLFNIILSSSAARYEGCTTLISKIPPSHETNYRTCVSNLDLEPYISSALENILTIQSFPCNETIEFFLSERESLYFQNTRKFSPNYKVFILLPLETILESVHYLITRSGYGTSTNLAVLFYAFVRNDGVQNLMTSLEDLNNIPEPRFTCPLVILRFREEKYDRQVLSASILCYTCHGKARFSKVEISEEHRPFVLLGRHISLNSNGHGGTASIYFFIGRAPTQKVIQDCKRKNCWNLYVLLMKMLNISDFMGKTSMCPRWHEKVSLNYLSSKAIRKDIEVSQYLRFPCEMRFVNDELDFCNPVEFA